MDFTRLENEVYQLRKANSDLQSENDRLREDLRAARLGQWMAGQVKTGTDNQMVEVKIDCANATEPK
jgi:hypothetical protein